jgi:hypothetical protein
MKVDVRRIIASHIATMRDFSTNRYSKPDLIIFYGAPIAAAVAAIYFGWRFDAGVLNSLLTAFSIFAGLLLNLLLLVFTFSVRDQQPSMVGRIRGSLVKDLHDNIAYSILLSIVLVGVTMFEVARLGMKTKQEAASTGSLSTGVIIFLSANFVLTLLMILKRIYIILNHEIERPVVRKTA